MFMVTMIAVLVKGVCARVVRGDAGGLAMAVDGLASVVLGALGFVFVIRTGVVLVLMH